MISDQINEARPLLYPTAPVEWKKLTKSRCLRIPHVKTISSVILGLLLVAVSMFLLIGNTKHPKDNTPVIDHKLLGSVRKIEPKAFDHSWKDSDTDLDFRNKENKDSFGKLGSVRKIDPKAFDHSWKDSDTDLDFRNKENKDSFGKLGSVRKIDPKAFDYSWKNGDKNFDSRNKGYKKSFNKLGVMLVTIILLPIGSVRKIDPKANDYSWKNGDFDSRNKGYKESFDKSGGCPYSKFRQHSLAAPIPQEEINCALIAENIRRSLGTCVDLSFLPEQCKETWPSKCRSNYKYRKLDGTCNNKIHPTWGKAKTPFIRMTAPSYADGVSSIRTSINGDSLPNCRTISTNIYSNQLRNDSELSTLFTSFGLFLDHDMMETASPPEEVPCCLNKFLEYPSTRPAECLQIEIPKTDSFYGPNEITCLNLLRSVPIRGECGGRREQLNLATSFLDGSVIYGSLIEKSKKLRSFNSGKIRTTFVNEAPFMAFAEDSRYHCGTESNKLKCFATGDSRANMAVELIAMHVLWYREHNKIAEELKKLNPSWIDETLFHEARKIVIAELQHITYKEFLPFLLGEKAIKEYELKIDEKKIYDGYDPTIHPGVFNVFGAAAFRFGHSLIQEKLHLANVDNTTEDIPLHQTFYNNELIFDNNLDAILRGLMQQSAHSVDSYASPEVQDHLFQSKEQNFGYDLVAIDIQRARDHGIPPYVKWREICSLTTIRTWDDLYPIMDRKRVDALKSVYSSVEDIDLPVGALAENPYKGSLLGPTYLCIIGRQFKKTRHGDRFWFEVQNEVGSLSNDQLKEIYKSSLARIICENSDNIQMIQKLPLQVSSVNNPVLNCAEVPKPDLSRWKSNT